QTMLPSSTSPLTNAGSNPLVPSGLINDQRGAYYARIYFGIVDIGAVEVQPQPFPIGAASTSTVTTPGEASYSFTVTYSDPYGINNGLDVSTIIGNNNAVRVGSGAYSANAQFVSIDNSTNGTPRVVTYRI